MFERFKIEASASFDLEVCGPLIIGANNTSSIDPTKADDRTLEGLDMSTGRSVPVIPGSSIKGVFRNAVAWEQIMKNKDAEIKDNYFVTELFGKTEGSDACRSKISFHDAYARDGFKTAVRNFAAIEPVSQKTVKSALFNIESVVEGRFAAGFKIVNFSSEEMYSILRVLQKIDEGSVRFGGKTSRGFGKMKVCDFMMTVTTGFDKELCPIQSILGSVGEALKYRYRENEVTLHE